MRMQEDVIKESGQDGMTDLESTCLKGLIDGDAYHAIVKEYKTERNSGSDSTDTEMDNRDLFTLLVSILHALE